ncbi:hypothetical protein DAPPUDRAFT_103800 [Daphnia pulex]|uniref:Uncharacterized protein n=1 Tax=Daphnia pulex TaxID=6669 RepID=E9GKB9_DAPPU|nr:hypothetical protein DAPPUDRAFT_103800 [Daphnia pulex]|eukprot:EFX79961.1 hypothetical protein DAPPUDRAFT_103800 [Daphnia pulex]
MNLRYFPDDGEPPLPKTPYVGVTFVASPMVFGPAVEVMSIEGMNLFEEYFEHNINDLDSRMRLRLANADSLTNLGAEISTIHHTSTELLARNDIKGCWAILDELFPRQFFYRLKLKPPYSGGKGKPRYTAKRQLGKEHVHRPLAFNSDHLTPEAKEKLCELEEEQQLQDTLSKEAAARAAIEAEQTKVLYKISNFERKQAELQREKIELSIKYKETLAAHASSSDEAVNTVLITPPVTPAKGHADHFLSVFKKRELDKEKEELKKQKKEKEEEEKLLKEVYSMDIETTPPGYPEREYLSNANPLAISTIAKRSPNPAIIFTIDYDDEGYIDVGALSETITVITDSTINEYYHGFADIIYDLVFLLACIPPQQNNQDKQQAEENFSSYIRNYFAERKCTVLHVAVTGEMTENIELIKLLIKLRTDPNAID